MPTLYSPDNPDGIEAPDVVAPVAHAIGGSSTLCGIPVTSLTDDEQALSGVPGKTTKLTQAPMCPTCLSLAVPNNS